MEQIEPYGIIYLTTNLINNKKSIGKHKINNSNINDSYLGSGKLLNRAINKYGKNNFAREILEITYSEDELNSKERYYINKFNAINSKDFYNIHIGGEGGDTFSGRSEEEKSSFREKMSVIVKERYANGFRIEYSPEMKERLRASRAKRKEVYKTKEFRETMSKATKGNLNGMYGKHHSQETKNRISKLNKGKRVGENNGNFGNIGDKAKNGKKVYQYKDKEKTILINSFNTVRQVLQYLNVKGHCSLNDAIKNNTMYKGYYWDKE